MMIAALSFADTKKTEKSTEDPNFYIMNPKKMATVDRATGKVSYESGVKPEEVVEVLLRDVINLQTQLKTCQEKLERKKNDALH